MGGHALPWLESYRAVVGRVIVAGEGVEDRGLAVMWRRASTRSVRSERHAPRAPRLGAGPGDLGEGRPRARVARVRTRADIGHRRLVEHEIAEGHHSNRAAAARHYGITRARMTQLMNLLEMPLHVQGRVLGPGNNGSDNAASERSARVHFLGSDYSA